MDLSNMNLLYDGFLASIKGSAWKEEPQRFEINLLTELTALSNEISSRTYQTSSAVEFTLNERGKTRHIHSQRMRDRVVRHVLCDTELRENLHGYLIYNNGASQTGKGLSFARRMIERDLHNFWLKYRTNDGYIAMVDLSKFYDNVRHDKVRELIYPRISEQAQWLMDEILRRMEKSSGEPKGVNIGDQVSQEIGIYFPTRIDNYVKIVRAQKWYGRYMDDMYIICKDRNELLSIIDGIAKAAEEIGLLINERKTHIAKLSDTFRYLQIKYRLTESGKIVRRINPKNVTRERRRLKKYRHLVNIGRMAYQDVEQAARSWMGNYAKLMSKQQIRHMKALYKELFRKELVWKR